MKSVSLMRAAAMLAISAAALYGQYSGPSVTVPGSPSLKLEGPPGQAPAVTRILPGDMLAISTLNVPELTLPAVRVEPNGNVNLPYVGTVKVDGETTTELSADLSKRLSGSGVLVDPQITIQITDSPTRIIAVVGEVKTPKTIPAFGNFHLLDVISACGGLTNEASHNVTIRRGSDGAPLVVQLGVNPLASDPANIPLMSGDTVIVPRVGNVFVLGEVKSPQSFPLSGNDPITVTRALTMAGGVKYSAGLSKARITRRDEHGKPQQIPLDIHRIIEGKDPDPVLVADDVLFLPANAFKAALSSGGASVATSALYGIGFIATK